MKTSELDTKTLSILFVMDDRISREKSGILTRIVTTLKSRFSIDLLQGHETNEPHLLERIQKTSPHLVLVPMHHYAVWNRIEAHFGASRTSGPTFAGYFCEPQSWDQWKDPTGQNRRIILDLVNLDPNDVLKVLGALVDETHRSGLTPLLGPQTPIYCENWYGKEGFGQRIENLLSLPEILNSHWTQRNSNLRILASALWSLIYEEGPGKVETADSGKNPKAYFQIACDSRFLLMRLSYNHFGRYTSKDALNEFWPKKGLHTSAAQLLLQYSDLVRVLVIPEISEIELTIGLIALGKDANKNANPLGTAKTLWIESHSARLVQEPSYSVPGPNSPHLKSFLGAKASITRLVHSQNEAEVVSIEELKGKLKKKEEQIEELKSGGVGTAPPLPMPDIESILEAFQTRYFEARYQIHQFENQIAEMEKKGSTPEKIQDLKLKMEALANREKVWIKKLLITLETYKTIAKTSGNKK